MNKLMQQSGFPNPWVNFSPTIANPVNIQTVVIHDAFYIELGADLVQMFMLLFLVPTVALNAMTWDVGLPVPTTMARVTDLVLLAGGGGQITGTWNPATRVINMSALADTGLDQFGPFYQGGWQYFKA